MKVKGKAEYEAELAAKAIHRTKVVNHDDPDIELSRRHTVERKECILKDSKGKAMVDVEGSIIKTQPFHRTVIRRDVEEKVKEPVKTETNITPLAKESKSSGHIDTATMEVPDLSKWIEENKPDSQILGQMKEVEKGGRKRPQAYKLFNSAIRDAKLRENK